MITCGARHYLDPSADGASLLSLTSHRALFLDRDGIVNVDRGYVHTPEQTMWIPGIFELCRAATARGYLPIVVTNQAGIGRGLYSEAQFLQYSAWVHQQFSGRGSPLWATYYCPHHPDAALGEYKAECDCRKPRPGMILGAAAEWSIDLAGSILLGDKESDIQAAMAAKIGRAKLFSAGQEGCALPSFDILFDE